VLNFQVVKEVIFGAGSKKDTHSDASTVKVDNKFAKSRIKEFSHNDLMSEGNSRMSLQRHIGGFRESTGPNQGGNSFKDDNGGLNFGASVYVKAGNMLDRIN